MLTYTLALNVRTHELAIFSSSNISRVPLLIQIVLINKSVKTDTHLLYVIFYDMTDFVMSTMNVFDIGITQCLVSFAKRVELKKCVEH